MAWSDRRLIEYDAELGRSTYYRFNPSTWEYGVEEVWDVDPVTEAAKAVYNKMDERSPWKGDWHHVASIPLAILEEYKKRGVDLLRDKVALKRFLNDKDHQAFRTRPGRI